MSKRSAPEPRRALSQGDLQIVHRLWHRAPWRCRSPFGTCHRIRERSPLARLTFRQRKRLRRSAARIGTRAIQRFARFISSSFPKLEIARRLKLSRNTVPKFLQAETFPERCQQPYGGSILDPYKPFILERWKAGCWNGMQILEEIEHLGYTGSEALLRYFLTQVRKQHRAAGTALALELSTARGSISAPADLPAKSTPKCRMSPARASWLCMCEPDKLDEQQRKLIEQIRTVHHDLETAYTLSQAFVSMLAERRAQDLDNWLLQAKQSGICELKSFARGIRRDYAAVKAALPSAWSNGPSERQVNRLKLIKTNMYGRAQFDLLRLRMLHGRRKAKRKQRAQASPAIVLGTARNNPNSQDIIQMISKVT